MPAELDFESEESFSNRYHSIQQVLDAAAYTTVDVKVKIMLKQEEKELVFTHGTTKYKVDATVGDKTNIIKLALWEDCIGKSYHIQNCKVRIFNDKKFLSTNDKTLISEIEDLTDVNLAPLQEQQCIIKAKCLGLEVSRHSACVVCNKNI